MHCLIPPMTIIPEDDWFCPRCTVSIFISYKYDLIMITFFSKIEPPPNVVKKILTWRWVTHPDSHSSVTSDTTTSEITKVDENGESATTTTTIIEKRTITTTTAPDTVPAS